MKELIKVPTVFRLVFRLAVVSRLVTKVTRTAVKYVDFLYGSKCIEEKQSFLNYAGAV